MQNSILNQLTQNMSLLLKIRHKSQTAFKFFSLSQNQFLPMITSGWWTSINNSAWNIKSLSSTFLLTIKQRIKRGTVRIESIINFSHLFMWKMATSKTCSAIQQRIPISKIGLTGTTAIHQASGDVALSLHGAVYS